MTATFSTAFLGHGGHGRCALGALVVGQEPVQFPDGERLVHVVAGAHLLAGVVADAAADTAGKGWSSRNRLEGLLVFARVDQGDVALDADVRRAGRLAGRGAALVDGVGARHGLGVVLVDRLALGEPLVVVVGRLDGADLGAFAAARALGQVHVAGGLAHGPSP